MNAKSLPTRQELAGDDFFQNPYPYYTRLRDHPAPCFLPHQQETSTSGILLFSRYHDAMAIFSAAQGISKNIRGMRPEGMRLAFDMNLLHRDGQDHLRLRRLVNEWFSVRAVDRLRSTIHEVARELLTPLVRRSDFDLVAEFAEPLPLAIIARLIGVPGADMRQIRAWSLLLCDGFDSLLGNPDIARRQKQVMEEFLAYVVNLVETKRALRDDSSLLGFLIRSSPERIDQEELVAMTGFLLFAGNETTVNLIASAVWLLLTHPGCWSLLHAQPELIPDAIEEVLRFESPEQRTSFRIVKTPIDINGHKLEPGQQISVVIGSVNRDEAVFERADAFDVRRRPNRHLAFGIGAHNCIGKTLARVEAQIALQTLLEFLPAPPMCERQPLWRKNSFFRGLASLHLAPGNV